MAAMVVRIGVLALVGLLGALGSLLITRSSLASAGPTDSTTTTTTAASTTVGTSVGTTTVTSTLPPATPPVGVPVTPALARNCVTAGGVMLLVPGREPVVLVADPAHSRASSGPFIYPRSGALVTVAAVGVRANGCGGSSQATVLSPSLFDGAVTARAASLTAGAAPARAALRGLRVAGKPRVLVAGKRASVEAWGYATKGERRPLGPGHELEAALAVHLLAPHAGLPRGAILVVGFAIRARRTAPAAPSRRRAAHRPRPQTSAKTGSRRPQARRGHAGGQRTDRSRFLARLQRAHKPLEITPPLGLSRYIFPVAGPASFTDTYGADRSDVSWHHGDDIFAPLGTPVVAVADGTLNRVGWEKLGGWRLWVRDRLGNEFYYAHLSGYTRAALQKGRITAGTVLGFVGDTGDAFGTPFHLHFEIHPRSLLPLRYDGAVDPTSYLDHWAHPSHEHGSRPLHPHFPSGPARAQAIYVYRELLAARGLIRHRPPQLRVRQPRKGGGDFGSKPAAPKQPVRTRRSQPEKARNVSASTFTLEGVAIAFLAAPAALAATLFRRKR
jgi:murein DD-endopeptidase MepM/ murein hydrolase activator NlpD